jgi:hypothetical protein
MTSSDSWCVSDSDVSRSNDDDHSWSEDSERDWTPEVEVIDLRSDEEDVEDSVDPGLACM